MDLAEQVRSRQRGLAALLEPVDGAAPETSPRPAPLQIRRGTVEGLVLFALDALGSYNAGRCCPRCCVGCEAIQTLANLEQLDELASDNAGAAIWWDEVGQRVDREWLTAMWKHDCDQDED